MTSYLRRAREARGIGQRAAAAAVGVDQSTWARWEKTGVVPPGRVVQVARALGVPSLALQPEPTSQFVEAFLWRMSQLTDEELVELFVGNRLAWEAAWDEQLRRAGQLPRVRDAGRSRAGRRAPATGRPSPRRQ